MIKTARIALALLLASSLTQACSSGYRRGPSVYSGVQVDSPFWKTTSGDGSRPKAAPLPSMGRPEPGLDAGRFESSTR